MAVDDLTALDGGDIPIGTLHEAPTTSRQVEGHLRCPQRQVLEVDHVEIGQHANLHRAPIVQADLAGGVTALPLHDVLQRQALTLGSVSHPVGQHVGGIARITDHPAVRTTIGQTGQGALVEVHLADHVEVAVGEVGQREQDQLSPVALQQQVVGQLDWFHPGGLGPGLDAVLGGGLVVGRVTEGEHLVEGLGDDAAHAPGATAVLLNELRPHFGPAHGGHPLLQVQAGQLALVGGAGDEGMHGGLQAQQQTHRTDGHLGGHVRAGGPCVTDAVQHLTPALGVLVVLHQQHRQGCVGAVGQATEDLEVAVQILEVRHDLQMAETGVSQGRADAPQLGRRVGEGGDLVALFVTVVHGARGGEAQCAGLQRLQREAAHLGDLRLAGQLLVVAASVPHHVDPQRRVRHLRTHVDQAG